MKKEKFFNESLLPINFIEVFGEDAVLLENEKEYIKGKTGSINFSCDENCESACGN